MNIQDLLPVLLSFGITAVATPLLIPVLKRLKAGQTERKEGVKTHLAKAGTPTMGGIAILLGILVPGLIYLPGHPSILPVLILFSIHTWKDGELLSRTVRSRKTPRIADEELLDEGF